MKKILILGSQGMAGHLIYHYFKEFTDYKISDIARDAKYSKPKYMIDATDFNKLTEVLILEEPDVVINCIGILNKDAEDNPDKAILLNSYLPHFLAKKGKEKTFKVVHISTDCVFNGKKGNYAEASFKDGIGIYAQTKALGEIIDNSNLTIRTSIIGPELKNNGIGLLDWFLKQNGIIKGYTHAYWTGITTIELAKAIKIYIDKNITGLHHLVNNEKISKEDLLKIFKSVFDKTDLIIESDPQYYIDKSLVKTDHSFNYPVPSYKEMVSEMKSWINNHSNLYSN